jgi:hypothetical protein
VGGGDKEKRFFIVCVREKTRDMVLVIIRIFFYFIKKLIVMCMQ